MEETVKSLLYLLVYPGLVFMLVYGFFVEWVDRKLYARLQNRIGPFHVGPKGILQPVADFVKLMAKEDIVPRAADRNLFIAAPMVALASVLAAALLLPVWHFHPSVSSATSFQGDVIVLAYLLSVPGLAYFLAGWASNNPFSAVGAVRTMTLVISYEVPFFLAILSPAILAGTWRIAGIADYYQHHPVQILVTLFLGFPTALVCLQAKLERLPFDIPEAETELVGGTFTEYSGRKLAMFRLLANIEMVVGAGFLAAIFLGGFPGGLIPGFAWFIVKTLVIIVFLTALRTVTARIRIDQMVSFSWRYLAPIAAVQLAVAIAVMEFLS